MVFVDFQIKCVSKFSGLQFLLVCVVRMK